MTCADPRETGSRYRFAVAQYDLALTLTSGQAFRWESRDGAWEGVVSSRWVRLAPCRAGIDCETAGVPSDWDWLANYLQVRVDLERVLSEFPADEPMRLAVKACRGLRLLRQASWECLASFILSSTKQIPQIQQVIRLICARYGTPVAVPPGHVEAFAFPEPQTLADVPEAELRACKMGFRAPYLKAAARAVASGQLDLDALAHSETAQAREALMQLPGVGRKIADCVLLFAFGRQDAFPVDVWIGRALRNLYFPNRKVNRKQLEEFSQTHFGRFAGYAQQYLFHYMRTQRHAYNVGSPVLAR